MGRGKWNISAECRAQSIPLGGRDGLPCGEPLRRWGQRTNGKSEKRDRRNIRF